MTIWTFIRTPIKALIKTVIKTCLIVFIALILM